MPDQGYYLKSVNGDLEFTESSLSSEQLTAKVDNNPVDISITPGEIESDLQARINVSGHLPVKTVLSPVPVLKSYMDGSAGWNVMIDIPRAEENREKSLVISVQSDLQGVSSSLPLPFDKKVDVVVPFDLTINIKPDKKINLSLKYNDAVEFSAIYQKSLWEMNLRSPQLSGAIEFSADSFFGHPINFNIDYLNASAYVGEGGESVKFDLLPDGLPMIKLKAKEILWKNIRLKNIALKTHREKSGMIIDLLELDGPDIHIKGSGSWQSSWRYANRTTFDFTATTGNLGRCLADLEITDGIKDTEGAGNFKWAWNAEPYKFSWDLLEGTANLKLEDGKLVDIQPGAGRILGILNFETLLSLDFGKQVSGGFAFDDMNGTFRFADGNVYTEDFKIEGKVAKINMQGRVGLTAQDYEQTITVIPGVGSTLSVIGTVAGGATIGAAIIFFQKILGLDKIVEYKYSVTGSWNDPKVVLLSAPEEKTDNSKSTDDDF